MSLRRIFLTAFLIALSAVSSLQAQQATELNTKHIPESAVAAIAMFPQQFKNDKQFEKFPFEVGAAWGKRELGFDPMDATQITLIAKAPQGEETLQGGLPSWKWAAIMHFKTKQRLAGATIDQLTKGPDGKVYKGSLLRVLPSFLLVDDNTIVVGDDTWFDELQKAGTDSSLGKQLNTELAGGGDVVAIFDIKKIRPLLNQMTKEMPPGLPPAVNRLKELPELLNSKVVRLDLKLGQLKVQLNSVDVASAERAKMILTKAMSFGADMAVGSAATQMDTGDKVQLAAVNYFERLSGIIQRDLEPQLDGKKVVMELKGLNAMVLPTFVGMLLPAVQSVRESARRVASLNNLKQMSLACLNYESAYQHFPAQANYDANGKPLLSWRVHILPFIEQNALYKQFHLDEPWDSDHNKKLIAKMPIVYESPAVPALNGKTVYLGVAGEGGIFTGKKGTHIAAVADGTSNTALIVEVNPELAVEWTKPQDYQCDPMNPLKGLGNVQVAGFIAAMCDGSTHFIPNSVLPENWKLFTGRNDGKDVDWNF